ncbi:hypothetical protein BC939DRAFT_450509 [Gamsiella multidivaricata]|uniref:uncharacterized protein n=1 Tax=Gamsiella multidivaricata TaxID=101098 RepID=UPI00221F8AAB|nr:uncharacterized protein BC939DRAFT_450509 [Gamsiella multidivaricata]KAI7824088.1 hypothetical protein BC939DRAFT_450509 [Gamsiella multidivaricata]
MAFFKDQLSVDSMYQRYLRDLQHISNNSGTPNYVKTEIERIVRKTTSTYFAQEAGRRSLKQDRDSAENAVASTLLGVIASGSKRAHPHNVPTSQWDSHPRRTSSKDQRIELQEAEKFPNPFIVPPSQGEDTRTFQSISPAEEASATECSNRDRTEDEGESQEDMVALTAITPFADLVTTLYCKFRHKLTSTPQPITTFPSESLRELYFVASSILEKWDQADKITRKDCFVALSGIINTMSPANRIHYSKFDEIKSACVIQDMFHVSPSQRTIFQQLKLAFGNKKKQSLARLRRYCQRRSLEIEEQEEKDECVEGREEMMKEERKIMDTLAELCKEIEVSTMRDKPSEQEVVCVWRNIARVIFEDHLIVRIGELGAEATRENRVQVEEQFGKSDANIRSRKVDIYLQVPGQETRKPLGVCTWEAKVTDTSTEQLQIQLRKNIRTNAALANAVRMYVDPTFPRRSPIILDIEGPRALAYMVRKVDTSVFGAGAVSPQAIALPTCAEDIIHFLDSGHLSALLRVGEHNISFAEMVRAGIRKHCDVQLYAKVAGEPMPDTMEPSIIFTPTKKQQKQRQ